MQWVCVNDKCTAMCVFSLTPHCDTFMFRHFRIVDEYSHSIPKPCLPNCVLNRHGRQHEQPTVNYVRCARFDARVRSNCNLPGIAVETMDFILGGLHFDYVLVQLNVAPGEYGEPGPNGTWVGRCI